MMIKRIPGATRVLGKSQGYLGLPVLDQEVFDQVSGESHPTMTTAWEPDPRELDRLRRGGNVHVQIFGRNHPPIILTVGEPADDFLRLDVGGHYRNKSGGVVQMKSCVLINGGRMYSDGRLLYTENGQCLSPRSGDNIVADAQAHEVAG